MQVETLHFSIPEISDKLLAKLSKRIKPVVRDDAYIGVLQYIADVDPRKVSFLWSPEFTARANGLCWLGSFATLHTYGSPAMFKPNLAEVFAQMPAGYTKTADAFEVFGPETANDPNIHKAALNAGFHVAKQLCM
jgi:hypothetical protein